MNQNLIDIFRLLGAKLMHTADQHEVICINPSQFYKFRDVVFSAQNDLELLRSENEALKNQITAYQLTIENMEAEREAMMKQEPVATVSGWVGARAAKDQISLIVDVPAGFTFLRGQKLYANPLPAQQIPAEDKS